MYVTITDEEIVDLIKKGVLLKLGHPGEERIYKFHRTCRRYRLLRPSQHPKSGRWRYHIQFGSKGKDARWRTIYRNRLLWLFDGRGTVPNDKHIDHKDNNNQNDSLDNLELLDADENSRRTYTVAQFEEVASYFDRCGQGLE